MSPTDLDSPGKRIRFLRESKEITQETLARKVHVSQSAIAHWESDRWCPSKPAQYLLAEALGTSRSFLFGEAA